MSINVLNEAGFNAFSTLEELFLLKEELEDKSFNFELEPSERKINFLEEQNLVELDFGEKDVFHISKKEDGKLQFVHATEGYLDELVGQKLKSEEIGTLVEFEQILKVYGIEMNKEEKDILQNQIIKL